MKTILDNTERTFLVQALGIWETRDTFCNLADIPNVVKETIEKNGDFKIFEYWNRKLRVCSKKHINEMFKANSVNFKFK